MISCEITQNRVTPSLICADVFDGDDFSEWASLVEARVLGKVNGMDGVQYSVVRFEPRGEELADVINTPAGTWMLAPHEIRLFNCVQ